MAVSPADVRAIVERVCARPEMLDACARRELGTEYPGNGGLPTFGLPAGRWTGSGLSRHFSLPPPCSLGRRRALFPEP